MTTFADLVARNNQRLVVKHHLTDRLAKFAASNDIFDRAAGAARAGWGRVKDTMGLSDRSYGDRALPTGGGKPPMLRDAGRDAAVKSQKFHALRNSMDKGISGVVKKRDEARQTLKHFSPGRMNMYGNAIAKGHGDMKGNLEGTTAEMLRYGQRDRTAASATMDRTGSRLRNLRNTATTRADSFTNRKTPLDALHRFKKRLTGSSRGHTRNAALDAKAAPYRQIARSAQGQMSPVIQAPKAPSMPKRPSSPALQDGRVARSGMSGR